MMDVNKGRSEFAKYGIKRTGFYYAMSLIKGKYKLPIIYCLMMNGSTRYNELKRKIEAPAFRSLTNSLKELENDGLIVRKEYPQIPPKVEYSLSELGESMLSFLQMFCDWGCKHMPNPPEM